MEAVNHFGQLESLRDNDVNMFSSKIQKLKAYSARRNVDFGKGIGNEPVYLLYVLPSLFCF